MQRNIFIRKSKLTSKSNVFKNRTQTKKKCPHCRGMFPYLQRHITQCQSNIKSCDKCGKYFPVRQLQLHEQLCIMYLKKQKNQSFRIKKNKKSFEYNKKQTIQSEEISSEKSEQHSIQQQTNHNIIEEQPRNQQLQQLQSNHTTQVNHLINSGLQRTTFPNMQQIIIQLRQLVELLRQHNPSIEPSLKRVFRQRLRFMQIVLINNIGETILQHLRTALSQNMLVLTHHPNRGFTQEQIQSTFPKQDYQLSISNVCSVCMEELKLNDQIRKLNCLHYYHTKCIDPWLTMKTTCPTCRMNLNQ